MRQQNWAIVAAALLGIGLGGCKKEEPTPTPPAKPEVKPAPGTTTGADALEKARTQAEKLAAGASAPGSGTAQTVADASSRLASVKQLLDEKKLDEADKVLKSVEAEKDKLPEAAQQQLAAIRKSLDAARAAKAVDSGPKPPEVNVAVPGK